MSHRHECPASPDGLHSFAWPRDVVNRTLGAWWECHYWECHWCPAVSMTNPEAPMIHHWPENPAMPADTPLTLADGRAVIITYENPPGPHHGTLTYSAILDGYDGAPDCSTRHQVGWGPTPEAARDDLVDILDADDDRKHETTVEYARRMMGVATTNPEQESE